MESFARIPLQPGAWAKVFMRQRGRCWTLTAKFVDARRARQTNTLCQEEGLFKVTRYLALSPRSKAVVRRMQRFARLAVAAPVVVILRRLVGSVVTPAFPTRVGHLIVDPAAYLLHPSASMERDQPRQFRPILAVSWRECANRVVLDSWREHYTVISSPKLVQLFVWASRGTPLARSGGDLHGQRQSQITETVAMYGPKSTILRLSPRQAREGKNETRGVLPESRFVCLHVRPGDSPYFFPDSHPWHSYRIGDIGTYSKAIKFLQEQGLTVVLMGDPSQPVPDPGLGLLDYAHGPKKSELNDILLASSCEFWLGDNSGASNLAWAYGRPTAIANVAPISQLLWGSQDDLKIPRLYSRTSDGSNLSFAEALDSAACSAHHEDVWRAAGLWPHLNTQDELLDLAREMLARVRGDFVADPEDVALEERLKSRFGTHHATFGGAVNISHAFLRRHASLVV